MMKMLELLGIVEILMNFVIFNLRETKILNWRRRLPRAAITSSTASRHKPPKAVSHSNVLII